MNDFPTFETFAWATGLFIALLATQILWWRVFHPKRLIAPLFGLFGLGPIFLHPLHGDLLITWLCLAVSSVYIMVFPAVSAESPSLVLLQLIDRYPGLSANEICHKLSHVRLLEDRLVDLQNDGLVSELNPRIRLTTKGRMLALFFYHYRRLLGLPWGTA